MSKITVLVVLVLLMACEKTHVSEECKDWRRGYGEELALAMGCPRQEGGFLTKPNITKPNIGPVNGAALSNKTCNKFVKRQLRNPLSADFKGFLGMGGAATRLPGPTPRWKVTSHVDTKNEFGVTKRTAFKCTVEYVGEDRWKLIDLDMTDLGVK